MRRAAATLLAAILIAAATQPVLAADTIILVTTTGDLGGTCPGSNCTLRAAIAYANASPTLDQIIGFNISGACPQTIKVFSELPPIGDSLSIRGYTQTGASPNSSSTADNATICVQLQPTTSGSNIASGLRFAPTDTASTFDVSGLSIGGFNDGIRIEGGNYTIGGNFLGVDADGVTQRTNSYNGIRVQASNAYFASTRLIGGSDPAQRNVISENGIGVALYSGGGNQVNNNFIGTTRSGNTAAGNGNGIYASSLFNDISGNAVSGNTTQAIRIEGPNGGANYVGFNRIGLKNYLVCFPPPCAPSAYALANGGSGVRIAGGAAGNNISANQIAWNGGDGIELPDAGQLNYISENSMHDNMGLGIDLGTSGVDANNNDATESASSPNRGLNYPVLNFAGGGDHGGTVYGNLQSTNGHYTIEFYADDTTGHAQGLDFLGSADVDITNAPTGSNGQVVISMPVSSNTDLVGRYISAIARDADGNTSEFSTNKAYVFVDSIFANGFDPFVP